MKKMLIIAIGIALIFTMIINATALLRGGANTHLVFLNHYNRSPIGQYPSHFTFLMYLFAILQILAAALLVASFTQREFLTGRNALFCKWGIFFAIFSVTIYGYMTRIISNHGAAATLFFHVGLLYLYLWFVEQGKGNSNQGLFRKMKILPIYILLFYTMGFPGWQKLFNSSEVMGTYTNLFSKSFLSKMPGGIEPLIYFLGILEISVPILLVISLIRKEFDLGKQISFLNTSLLVTVVTFIILCFGLSVVLNYVGATNLVFYSIFTLGLYSYVDNDKNRSSQLQ